MPKLPGGTDSAAHSLRELPGRHRSLLGSTSHHWRLSHGNSQPNMTKANVRHSRPPVARLPSHDRNHASRRVRPGPAAAEEQPLGEQAAGVLQGLTLLSHRPRGGAPQNFSKACDVERCRDHVVTSMVTHDFWRPSSSLV